MAGEDVIMVSQRELKRLHIIQKVLNEKLSQVEAGEILLLSDRQIRRIVSKIIPLCFKDGTNPMPIC